MPDLKDFHVDESKVWYTGGYWPEGVPKQVYEVEDMEVLSLKDSFLKAADRYDLWERDICIFVLGPYLERIKHKQLYEYGIKFGTFLYDKLGIRKGDVVAIDLPNSINFVIAYIGCQHIGAIVAGVNPQYKPMELLHELTVTNAKVLVLMDALYIAGPNSILSKTSVKHLVSTNLLDFVTAEPDVFTKLREQLPDFQDSVPDKGATFTTYRMKKIIEETEGRDIEVEIDPWEDPAVYLMTGGTTGLPKAAVLTHANLTTDLQILKPWTKIEPGMITIGSIPFFHSFGMTCVMNASLAIGMTMLLFPKPPPDEDLCAAINKIDAPEGIMYTGVEMLFKRLTDFVEAMGEEEFKKQYDFWKKLKLATQGAGPLHDYVREPFERIFNCPIRSGYGLTETSPVVSTAPFWGKYKAEKLGLPLPGVDWAVFDSNNFEAGPICDGTPEMGNFGIEHTGEICIAGSMVMKGYLGKEAEEGNIKDWAGKRWLLTGDIGYMDEHGFMEIRDRKKSLIKVSGHSVFPKEVEELMGMHEMVDEVAVAGIPDEMMGETVKAWVTLKPGYKDGKDIDAEVLKKWCVENMTKWKSPRYIEFLRKLPVSLTGKVQRRVLQEKDIEKLNKGRTIKG